LIGYDLSTCTIKPSYPRFQFLSVDNTKTFPLWLHNNAIAFVNAFYSAENARETIFIRRTKMIFKTKKGFRLLAITLAATVMCMALAVGCTTQKETLVFADLDWDSAQVHSRIASFIVEHGYGYGVDYNFGSTIPMFIGLEDGSNDISMEIWVENQQEPYDAAIAAGTVLDLGTNFNDDFQGWLVPTYMIEDGLLPADISVFDMPEYWELFKDPDDPSKGRFYSCIPGWACELINAEKFEEYGLTDTYNIFEPGSGAALLASMVNAYEQREPWFGYYWSPTPALGLYDMTVVEEPPYDETTWNTNHACAYPAVNVNICVNSSLPDKAPEVVEFLENYETTAAMTNKALAYMETNEATTEEAAIYFLEEYESVWMQWVPADVAQKVKDAMP
jgi:glycine betaine/proline transport system substrate-binding protein